VTTIETARHAGACYGVERALKMVGECARTRERVATIGPLIHNPSVVARLASDGVVSVGSVDEVPAGTTVVIRSHGVVPQVVERACARGLEVVDATCPHVKKAHEGAAELAAAGYQVVVVGEAGHPEVEGILARAGEGALVVGSAEEAATAEVGKRVGVVVQTTQSQALLAAVVGCLVTRVRDLRVINTVCAATVQRQQAARELAARVDAMVVVGGRNSGNTRRLAEVCAEKCAETHHVELPDELEAAWFADVRAVGVTAGASTPAEQVDAVVAAVRGLVDAGEVR
jgi:4-hydroxy-3-methylbut-2-enyl diphosphate reductase